MSSTPVSRRWRLRTICGSNVPDRSRGTSIVTSPDDSVNTVSGRVPPAWSAVVRVANGAQSSRQRHAEDSASGLGLCAWPAGSSTASRPLPARRGLCDLPSRERVREWNYVIDTESASATWQRVMPLFGPIIHPCRRRAG
jgi:hypothetical protein